MLTRQQKEQQVADLQDKLRKIKSIIFTNYHGVKVEEISQIRNELRKEGIEYHIIKNRLFKIALTKADIKVDSPDNQSSLFKQPLALAFSYNDEVIPAKILFKATEEIESLKIIGGIYEKHFISQDEIKKLAQLPRRNELLAKMIGSINAPLAGVVNVLAGNMRGLVSVLSQYQLKNKI